MLVMRTFMVDEKTLEILDNLKESLGVSRSEALRRFVHNYGDLVMSKLQDDRLQKEVSPAP